jgi:hypothetical protein
MYPNSLKRKRAALVKTARFVLVYKELVMNVTQEQKRMLVSLARASQLLQPDFPPEVTDALISEGLIRVPLGGGFMLTENGRVAVLSLN